MNKLVLFYIPPIQFNLTNCLQTNLELTAINVALNGLAKDCGDRDLSDVILDGNKDPKHYVNIQCGITKSFVAILLNGTFEIHYVVVYGGEGMEMTSEMNALFSYL